MKTKKITSTEISASAVASLPTRPSSDGRYGSAAYTASELKAAFDKLPLLVIERFNALLDDVADGSLLASLPSGIKETESLSSFLKDVESGSLASYLKVGDTTLAELAVRLSLLEERTKNI